MSTHSSTFEDHGEGITIKDPESLSGFVEHLIFLLREGNDLIPQAFRLTQRKELW